MSVNKIQTSGLANIDPEVKLIKKHINATMEIGKKYGLLGSLIDKKNLTNINKILIANKDVPISPVAIRDSSKIL